jgi:archaellum component FlaF (FlaF/FlaG flagellin family)
LKSKQIIEKIQIQSSTGQLLLEQIVRDNSVEIALPEKNGIYFIKIVSKNGNLVFEKVMKL